MRCDVIMIEIVSVGDDYEVTEIILIMSSSLSSDISLAHDPYEKMLQ